MTDNILLEYSQTERDERQVKNDRHYFTWILIQSNWERWVTSKEWERVFHLILIKSNCERWDTSEEWQTVFYLSTNPVNTL